MSPKVVQCNLCLQENPDKEPFSVPVGDVIGEVLLKTHFEEKHKMTLPLTLRREL